MEDLPYIFHIKCYVKINYLEALMEEWKIFFNFIQIIWFFFNLVEKVQPVRLYPLRGQNHKNHIFYKEIVPNNKIILIFAAQKVLQINRDKEYVYRSDNGYIVYDRFMGLWLLGQV